MGALLETILTFLAVFLIFAAVLFYFAIRPMLIWYKSRLSEEEKKLQQAAEQRRIDEIEQEQFRKTAEEEVKQWNNPE